MMFRKTEIVHINFRIFSTVSSHEASFIRNEKAFTVLPQSGLLSVKLTDDVPSQATMGSRPEIGVVRKHSSCCYLKRRSDALVQYHLFRKYSTLAIDRAVNG